MSPNVDAFFASSLLLLAAAGRATFLRAGEMAVGGFAACGALVDELNGAASQTLTTHKAAAPAANVRRKTANPKPVEECKTKPESVEVVTVVSLNAQQALQVP
jgi:hypothetical protein